MSAWISCDNCHDLSGCLAGKYYLKDGVKYACRQWKPIPCPRCGGALSTTREHNGRKYRHCYSCHGEFFMEDENG